MEENQVLNTEATTTNETVETVETQQPVEVEEKMLPQSKVNEIVQKRLEKVNKQWEEKFDALQESIKLQSMSEQEKADYDYNKRLADLEAREKAVQEREEAYSKSQYQAEIQRQLAESNLPDVSDLLVGLDAETVKAKIDSMKQSFNNQLNAQVQSKIQSTANTPTIPQVENKPLTMEDIAKMSHQEIIKRKAEVDKVVKEYYMTK
ncbi:MAG: head scaffolding protein [Malazfec virus 1]